MIRQQTFSFSASFSVGASDPSLFDFDFHFLVSWDDMILQCSSPGKLLPSNISNAPVKSTLQTHLRMGPSAATFILREDKLSSLMKSLL